MTGATGTRVEITTPILLVTKAETEAEAEAKVQEFFDAYGWAEDATVYVTQGRVESR